MRSRFLRGSAVATSLVSMTSLAATSVVAAGSVPLYPSSVPQVHHGPRTAVGDLLGDGLVDLCALESGEVRVRFSPGLYDSLMTDVLSMPANDLDVALDGDRVRLFAATSAGLVSTHWDPAQRAWIETVERTRPNWNDARLVRAVKRGPGLRPYIYGVMANGVEVRLLTPTAGGFSDKRVRMLTEEILALEDVSFVAGGLRELAVLTASGCSIYSGDPADIGDRAILSLATEVSSGETSLVVGSTGSPKDAWVAWLHDDAGVPRSSVSWLTPGGANETVVLQSTTPNGDPFGAGNLGATDLDGDSDLDLLVTNTQHSSIAALLNLATTPGTPAFQWSPAGVRSQLVAGADFDERPMFAADIDNDGDTDYGAGAGSLGRYYFVQSNLVRHRDLMPGIVTYETGGPSGSDLPEFHLSEDLQLSFALQPAATVPPGATDIELVFFTRPDDVTPLTPTPIFGRFEALGTTNVTFDLAGSVTEDPSTSHVSFYEMCFFTIRYVNRDPLTGEVQFVHPGQVFGLESRTMPGDPPSANANWLIDGWPGQRGDHLEVFLDARAAQPRALGGGSGCGSGGECLPCDINNPPPPGW